MGWWKFVCCGSIEIVDVYTAYNGYKSAGIHFVDVAGGRILVGEQSNKMIPCMSGLGGRREDNDPGSVYTAYRETVEELCGVKMTAAELRTMINSLVLLPLYSYYDDECGYVFYVLSQKHLIEIMKYVWKQCAGLMAHYRGARAPQSVDQIVRRRLYTKKSEVCKLYNLKIDDLLVLGQTEPAEEDVDALPYKLDRSFLADLCHIAYWLRSAASKPAGKKLKSARPGD